jgi:hypothetical protein
MKPHLSWKPTIPPDLSASHQGLTGCVPVPGRQENRDRYWNRFHPATEPKTRRSPAPRWAARRRISDRFVPRRPRSSSSCLASAYIILGRFHFSVFLVGRLERSDRRCMARWRNREGQEEIARSAFEGELQNVYTVDNLLVPLHCAKVKAWRLLPRSATKIKQAVSGRKFQLCRDAIPKVKGCRNCSKISARR